MQEPSTSVTTHHEHEQPGEILESTLAMEPLPTPLVPLSILLEVTFSGQLSRMLATFAKALAGKGLPANQAQYWNRVWDRALAREELPVGHHKTAWGRHLLHLHIPPK